VTSTIDRARVIEREQARLRVLGVLIDLDITGLSHPPACIAPIHRKTLRSLATRFRVSLAHHSFALDCFHPYRWLPYTAHAAWRAEYNRLQDELRAVRAAILDHGGIRAKMTRDLAQIVARIMVDYRAVIDMVSEHEAVADPRWLAMRQTEFARRYEHLNAVVSPRQDAITQLRIRIAHEAQDILAVIRRHGSVPGGTARRARALLTTFRLLDTQDDRDLEGRLRALTASLTRESDTAYDVTTVTTALEAVVALAREDA
jgi:hypothetical protein